MLTYLGFMRLLDPAALSAANVTLSTALIAGIIGLLIGFGKGRFVLSKTSTKNIERLNALSEPLPPRHVYSKRSWIVLSVMVLIALSLNTGLIPLAVYLRGAVNLAIGFALIISSLTYLSKGKAQAA